jgi:hypothetical protein
LIYYYSRGGVLALIVLSAVREGTYRPLVPLAIIWALWPMGGVIAASAGRVTAPYYWPFIPIYTLVSIVAKVNVNVLGSVLLFAGGMGLAFAALSFLPESLIVGLAAVLGIASGLFIVVGWILLAVRAMRDARHDRAVIRSLEREMSLLSPLEAIERALDGLVLSKSFAQYLVTLSARTVQPNRSLALTCRLLLTMWHQPNYEAFVAASRVAGLDDESLGRVALPKMYTCARRLVSSEVLGRIGESAGLKELVQAATPGGGNRVPPR